MVFQCARRGRCAGWCNPMSFRSCLLASSCLCGVACASFVFNIQIALAQSSAVAPGTTQLPAVVVEAQKPRRIARKKRTQAAQATPSARAAPRALLTVTPAAAGAGIVAGPAPVKEKYQLPQTSEGITRQKIDQTVNVVDTADAVKYL